MPAGVRAPKPVYQVLVLPALAHNDNVPVGQVIPISDSDIPRRFGIRIGNAQRHSRWIGIIIEQLHYREISAAPGIDIHIV